MTALKHLNWGAQHKQCGRAMELDAQSGTTRDLRLGGTSVNGKELTESDEL